MAMLFVHFQLDLNDILAEINIFGKHKATELKRLASSLFIALIVLNVMGYYGVILSLQYEHARQMTNLIDAGSYNQNETQHYKIPYKSTNRISSEVFERVNGDFEKDGQVYRLIKQRLYRDTFDIVYIKDKVATAIKDAITDYVSTFTEKSNDGQNTIVLPLFIKEYFNREFSIQQHTYGWAHAIRKESRECVLIDSFYSSIIHPPERG